MKDFWQLAKAMLKHRGLLVLAMVFAILSAGGLGVGLAGLAPILSNIVPRIDDKGQRIPGTDLPGMVNALNQKIGGHIPQSWIDALPVGPFNAVVWIVCAMGVVTLFGAVCGFLHAYLSMTVVSRTVSDLRQRCFAHVVHLPLRSVMSRPSLFVAQIVSDTAALAMGFTALVSKAFAEITKALAALAVALIMDWRLAIAAVFVGLPLGYAVRKAGTKIRRASRRGLERQGGMHQAATEAIDNLRVVKTSTSEAQEQARFAKASEEVVKAEMRVRTTRALASPLIETLSLFALGILCIIAARAIIDGAMEFNRFVIVLAALGIAAASFKPITAFWHDVQQSSGAASRLLELLGREQEEGHEASLPALPRHARSIRFENATLTYHGQDRPAVDNVSLEISHGMTVAFVGPNGSGKTSLLSLIPRLFNCDKDEAGNRTGRIYIDGIDICSVSLRSLREQIGVVTQETVLFAGTIRANIAYGRPGASDADIESAARRARAHEFIIDRPKGYDGEIGERGSGLSGGQRQRIAIARAILRDPAILILDEATSMIDADSEVKIAEALDEFSQGRTCLIVAHRLSTVVHADRIVVMDMGRVVDSGNHDELLARCATYRLIAEHQLVKAPQPAVTAR